jgi:hypothetical protein
MNAFHGWRSVVAAVAAVALAALVAVGAAQASHQFTDVPNGHPFHTEIGIFRDTNITSGCTATTFCPEDFVRRQAMAAFIDRALGLAVRPGELALRAVPGSKIATIDDGSSLVRTFDGGLEFSHNGFRALRLEGPFTDTNVIGGFAGNTVTPGVHGATVSGGGQSAAPPGINRVTNSYGTVGGGAGNRAGDGAGTTGENGSYATVGGGSSNTASGFHATVAGGRWNTASYLAATVAGGWLNSASGEFATVAGGYVNSATGSAATVAGGEANHATGSKATVAGGIGNTAAGTASLAAGRGAKANHTGSFVWGDFTNADVASPANNSFSVRASGGIWLGASSTPSIPSGQFLATSTGGHLTTGGAWTNGSDARAKERFAPVDTQEILRRVASMPIRSWSYKAEPGVRHLGPTAQDFRSAFRVGATDTAIATVDADGVALAAIQALYAENQRLRGRVASLERQNARLAALERAVAELTKSR